MLTAVRVDGNVNRNGGCKCFGEAKIISGTDGDSTKGFIDDNRHDVERLWGLKSEMLLIFVPNFHFGVGVKEIKELNWVLVMGNESKISVKLLFWGFYIFGFFVQRKGFVSLLRI